MSNKPKHTPGPWTARDSEVYFKEKGDVNRYLLCKTGINHLSMDETEANARLIAAAPDLLEAIKFVLNTVNNLDSEMRKDHFCWMHVNKLQKAIDKAEGK